jgi:hypothetical protein
VEEFADYVVGVAGFRRGGLSEGRRVQGVIRGVLSRPLGDVWVVGWIIWRGWGAGGLIER